MFRLWAVTDRTTDLSDLHQFFGNGRTTDFQLGGTSSLAKFKHLDNEPDTLFECNPSPPSIVSSWKTGSGVRQNSCDQTNDIQSGMLTKQNHNNSWSPWIFVVSIQTSLSSKYCVGKRKCAVGFVQIVLSLARDGALLELKTRFNLWCTKLHWKHYMQCSCKSIC